MCPCLRQGHISMYFSHMGTAIKVLIPLNEINYFDVAIIVNSP